MFPPNKILFPVDFSERSTSVAAMAAAFAQRFDATLTLLHVEPPPQPGFPVDSARARLEEFAAREEFAGTTIQIELASGDPAEKIVEFAHAQKADLIVMPTHGYGPFRRFLMGSVTLKVLHDAWCPVWTEAHLDRFLASHTAQFEQVLCAVDLTENSHPALKWAADFAESTGARLKVVHAVPCVAPLGPEFVHTDWPQQMVNDARDRVDSLQRSEGTRGEVEIITGEVAAAVRSAAEEAHADLVVIGRSIDDRPLGRLRTHAYPIIRHSPCPVVSV
jgi:nucleotide-binding universal stress UspA family protein